MTSSWCESPCSTLPIQFIPCHIELISGNLKTFFVHLFRNIGMLRVFTTRPRQHKDPFITKNQYFGCGRHQVTCSHSIDRVPSECFVLSTKGFNANVLLQNWVRHAILHIHRQEGMHEFSHVYSTNNANLTRVHPNYVRTQIRMALTFDSGMHI